MVDQIEKLGNTSNEASLLRFIFGGVRYGLQIDFEMTHEIEMSAPFGKTNSGALAILDVLVTHNVHHELGLLAKDRQGFLVHLLADVEQRGGEAGLAYMAFEIDGGVVIQVIVKDEDAK